MYLIIFFFSLKLAASTLQVQDRLKSYALSYSEKEIGLKTWEFEVNLEMQSCNEHILTEFNRKMAKLLPQKMLKKGTAPDDINFKLNGHEFHESPQSQIGQSLSLLPLEIRRMKMEEILICKKKK